MQDKTHSFLSIYRILHQTISRSIFTETMQIIERISEKFRDVKMKFSIQVNKIQISRRKNGRKSSVVFERSIAKE